MTVASPEPIASAESAGGAGYRGTGGGGTGGGGTGVRGGRPAYQVIERRGIFDFGEAHQVARGHFDQYHAAGVDEDQVEFIRDIVYLSAAEFSLLPPTLTTSAPLLPLQAPLKVGPQAITAAIVKADCTGLDYHYRRVDEDAVPLWDVALFGGDMSKIEFLQGDRLRLDSLEELILELEQRFTGSQTTIGKTIAVSGMLRVQGVLWKAKLAVNLTPADVEAQIDAYLERIPLLAG
jgi:hypothetical protein